MNALLLELGLERLKPFLTAMLLPPVPFLVLAAVALMLVRRGRHRIATGLLGASLALVWISGCIGIAEALAPFAFAVSPPLGEPRLEAMRRQADGTVAIIVLGGGVDAWAPEYRASSLQFRSLERLRYGLWLGRRTGCPVGFSGGLGWAQPPGAAREATVAQRIATEEFREPLRWVESESRDTRENAIFTVAMLKRAGVRHIVLVTHRLHMARALRNFITAGNPGISIEAAPIGLAEPPEWPALQWLPTGEGYQEVRTLAREWLGMLAGA